MNQPLKKYGSQIKLHCVQCAEEMPYRTDMVCCGDKYSLPICLNPKCPNFGLLQIGVEALGFMSMEWKPKYIKKEVICMPKGGKKKGK